MSVLLGKHLLAELHDCDRTLLDDPDYLLKHCRVAAKAMGATIVGHHSHRFDPIGVSVVLILAESHLSLHSWPEHRIASMDIFTCGTSIDPTIARDYLSKRLDASRVSEMLVGRGQLHDNSVPSWDITELAVGEES